MPPESVVYELFIAKTDKAQGNWLASCGMYQDVYLLGTAEKVTVPEGKLAHSLTLQSDGDSTYR